MKVLLLGSGGRESALGWALTRSDSVSELIAAPGNPGLAEIATVTEIDPCSPSQVVDLASRLGAGLVVVGPEAPLVAGVGDALREAGRAVFGPNENAARIEGSKAHAKDLMAAAGIPTARAKVFEEVTQAISFLDELGPPYVIKADGLAAGKGVVVTPDREEAVLAITGCLLHDSFGAAGKRVLVEEFLDGEETSLIAFSDGARALPCAPAQDYKRVGDNDDGPNTGGMGSYSPVPSCPEGLTQQILHEVIEPMLATTSAQGAPFIGALYAGLALTSTGPRVIEFNARFGDPETQALMPRLKSDLGEVCLAAAEGDLTNTTLEWSDDVCISVVLASGGYPGPHKIGVPITGTERASQLDGVHIFHAGTSIGPNGLETAGGRVLAVSATAPTFAGARERAYAAADLIEFEGKHIRRDIALRAVDA
jgi:phosphoribosylamine--glycine ligase